MDLAEIYICLKCGEALVYIKLECNSLIQYCNICDWGAKNEN